MTVASSLLFFFTVFLSSSLALRKLRVLHGELPKEGRRGKELMSWPTASKDWRPASNHVGDFESSSPLVEP